MDVETDNNITSKNQVKNVLLSTESLRNPLGLSLFSEYFEEKLSQKNSSHYYDIDVYHHEYEKEIFKFLLQPIEQSITLFDEPGLIKVHHISALIQVTSIRPWNCIIYLKNKNGDRSCLSLHSNMFWHGLPKTLEGKLDIGTRFKEFYPALRLDKGSSIEIEFSGWLYVPEGVLVSYSLCA
jgi:hypothetical protein